ncbi:MAG TPA: CRISPR-associated RAMP protein Csx7 [Ktedonobacteraceae bacterium]|jgi:CRISPR-associated RAMP protein (TIGR02581 family)|nr:CRISPR-associated RAMP protein Csx7 [Ktedonobacteraceae bacterium]
MLKKIVNEAFCTVRITTTGPLLVKSGHASVSGPDMTPVLTNRNGKQEVFIPGSSLKGVFRSHIEKIVCSLKSRVVCYPFELNNREVRESISDMTQLQNDYRESCGGMFNQYARRGEENRRTLEDRTDLVYAASCPTCRLFGSTAFIGRIAISDAYLVSEEARELRDGVGIDRLTGGASHGAKFDLEVVSEGVVFETTIHLRNFEIWQLGMLFIVLQDMENELLRLGSGRSRGLGQVKAEISLKDTPARPGGFVTSTLRQSDEPENELWGLGRWLNKKPEENYYGTQYADFLTLQPGVERVNRGIRSMRAFTGDHFSKLQDAAIENFVNSMKSWSDTHARRFLPSAVRG